MSDDGWMSKCLVFTVHCWASLMIGWL